MILAHGDPEIAGQVKLDPIYTILAFRGFNRFEFFPDVTRVGDQACFA